MHWSWLSIVNFLRTAIPVDRPEHAALMQVKSVPITPKAFCFKVLACRV